MIFLIRVFFSDNERGAGQTYWWCLARSPRRQGGGILQQTAGGLENICARKQALCRELSNHEGVFPGFDRFDSELHQQIVNSLQPGLQIFSLRSIANPQMMIETEVIAGDNEHALLAAQLFRELS